MEKYIKTFLPLMSETFLLVFISLTPPQLSLKQGKPYMKAYLNGEAPLKIQQHISINNSSSSCTWMAFILYIGEGG